MTAPVVPAGPRVVLDTNIVLDLLVFDDQAVQPLHAALDAGQMIWLSSAEMRDELQRVLDYPQIAPRLAYYRLTPEQVLAHFDRLSCRVEAAPKAGPRCSDTDDQRFIDLAVAHGASLLSKDRAVLKMKRRLERLGVTVAARWPAPCAACCRSDIGDISGELPLP